MANSLYNQLSAQGRQSSVGELFSNLRQSTNPSAMLSMMAQQNPTLASILRDVAQNGGDARGLFYKRASQMGINPNDILSMLKQQ